MITAKWDRFRENQVNKTTNPVRRLTFLNKTAFLLQDAIEENKAIGNRVSIAEAKRQQERLNAINEEISRIVMVS